MAPTEDIVIIRNIELPQGGSLEVQLTQLGIDKMRQHFGLFGDQPLEDDHIRMYLWGTLDHAVGKAEREAEWDVKVEPDVTKPAGDAKRVRRTRRRSSGPRS